MLTEEQKKYLLSGGFINQTEELRAESEAFLRANQAGSKPQSGGIALPSNPNLPNQAGASSVGLSTSLPAINKEEIEAKTKAQFQPAKDALVKSFESRIGEAEGLSEQEKRAFEGQLGTRRRFSSSAAAFIKFVDDANKKKIATMEVERDVALANFDIELAKMIDSRIEKERAAQQQDFENMFKLMEIAEKQEQAAATKAKTERDILAPFLKSEKERSILETIQSGVKDIGEIFQTVQAKFPDLLTEDVTRVMTAVEKKNEEKAEINKLLVKLGENNAPADIIQSVSETTSLSEAVMASGSYLMGTTSGAVGEYLFYKRQREAAGLPPVDFDTWQNIDANRKAKVAAAATGAYGGMNSKQQQIFNSMADKLRKSPLVMATDRAVVLDKIVEEVKKDPSNGSLQLSLIYGYIQALDSYQSAVREGEINLVQTLLNIRGKLDVWRSNVEEDKRILDKNTALSIANNAETLIQTLKQGANRAEKEFEAQAKINGIGSAWNEYRDTVGNINSRDVSEDIETLEDSIEDWIAKNPENLSRYEQMVNENPELSDWEIAQILGFK